MTKMEPLFQRGDVWFGGGVIRMPWHSAPAVVVKGVDEAVAIASERLKAA